MVGVRERDLPPDWLGFREYFARTVNSELVRTESVGRVLQAIRHPAPPPVPIPNLLWRGIRVPARRALWLGGIGLMEPSLRARLGIGWTGGDEMSFRALGQVSRRLTPLMPERLQTWGRISCAGGA